MARPTTQDSPSLGVDDASFCVWHFSRNHCALYESNFFPLYRTEAHPQPDFFSGFMMRLQCIAHALGEQKIVSVSCDLILPSARRSPTNFCPKYSMVIVDLPGSSILAANNICSVTVRLMVPLWKLSKLPILPLPPTSSISCIKNTEMHTHTQFLASGWVDGRHHLPHHYPLHHFPALCPINHRKILPMVICIVRQRRAPLESPPPLTFFFCWWWTIDGFFFFGSLAHRKMLPNAFFQRDEEGCGGGGRSSY